MEQTDKVEHRLIRLLLNNEFYEQNKARIVPTMFPAELRTLYETICGAHSSYQRDLTFPEVKALHETQHPTLTTAQRNNLQELIASLEQQPPLGADVAGDVMRAMWRVETYREIADLALRGVEGQLADLGEIAALVESRSVDFIPDETSLEPVTDDFDEILEANEKRYKWRFNIRALAEKIPGCSGGDFLIFFARPEVGKTATHVSLTAAPDGWAWQGAKVLVIVNEEAGERTKMRHITAATQTPSAKLAANKDKAREIWGKVKGNIVLIDEVGLTMGRLNALVKKIKPDIVIVDQLDKINVDGKFAAEHERLREVYKSGREVAKRHDCVVVGISQASDAATGKTWIDYSMMENSRTGKGAEADVIIGVAPNPYAGDGEQQDYTRFLCVSKNKLTGYHGKLVSKLDHLTSTYL